MNTTITIVLSLVGIAFFIFCNLISYTLGKINMIRYITPDEDKIVRRIMKAQIPVNIPTEMLEEVKGKLNNSDKLKNKKTNTKNENISYVG